MLIDVNSEVAECYTDKQNTSNAKSYARNLYFAKHNTEGDDNSQYQY